MPHTAEFEDQPYPYSEFPTRFRAIGVVELLINLCFENRGIYQSWNSRHNVNQDLGL